MRPTWISRQDSCVIHTEKFWHSFWHLLFILFVGVLSFVYNTDTDESSGKWGDWISDQDCSRTCGGGVLVESRECQDGDCTGPSKRYSSCNTQECPPNTKDFRLEQCQKFNSVPFERKLYDWIPYLKAPRKCELNCMPRGERFYYRHEKMVQLKIRHSSFKNHCMS